MKNSENCRFVKYVIGTKEPIFFDGRKNCYGYLYLSDEDSRIYFDLEDATLFDDVDVIKNYSEYLEDVTISTEVEDFCIYEVKGDMKITKDIHDFVED